MNIKPPIKFAIIDADESLTWVDIAKTINIVCFADSLNQDETIKAFKNFVEYERIDQSKQSIATLLGKYPDNKWVVGLFLYKDIKVIRINNLQSLKSLINEQESVL